MDHMDAYGLEIRETRATCVRKGFQSNHPTFIPVPIVVAILADRVLPMQGTLASPKLKTQAHLFLRFIVPTVLLTPPQTGLTTLVHDPRNRRRVLRRNRTFPLRNLRNLPRCSLRTPPGRPVRLRRHLAHPPASLLAVCPTLLLHRPRTVRTLARVPANLGTIASILVDPTRLNPRVNISTGVTSKSSKVTPPNTASPPTSHRKPGPLAVNAGNQPEHFNSESILPSTLTSGDVKTTSRVEFSLIIVVHFPRLETRPIVLQTPLRTGVTNVLRPPVTLFLGLKHPPSSLVVLPLPVITVLLSRAPRVVDREVEVPRHLPQSVLVLPVPVLILSRHRREVRPSRAPVRLHVGTPPRTHLTLTKVNPRVSVANI